MHGKLRRQLHEHSLHLQSRSDESEIDAPEQAEEAEENDAMLNRNKGKADEIGDGPNLVRVPNDFELLLGSGLGAPFIMVRNFGRLTFRMSLPICAAVLPSMSPSRTKNIVVLSSAPRVKASVKVFRKTFPQSRTRT